MIFENVQKLVIPEGEVVLISHGNTVLWKRPGLPLAYQRVEYIQSDGNQYFDTGVNASTYPDGIRYVFRGNTTKYQSTSTIYWFGALANGRRSGNAFTNNGNFGMFFGGSGGVFYAMTQPSAGKDIELIAQGTPRSSNDCIVTLNGTQISRNGTLTDSEMPNANIYFLTAYGTSASNTANMKYYGKIYSFTMDDVDGNPIRNFIPCYRKSDGVIGLYDTVGGMFYTNKGTGSFTKGADI